MCMREATSANTPPYCACLAACEAMTFDKMVVPSATTAAAVSSQEVSIPRMRGMLDVGGQRSEVGGQMAPPTSDLLPPTSDFFDLQHKILVIMRQRLELQRLRVEPDGVFDADAEALLGIIQAWFDGDDDARLEAVGVAFEVGQLGKLMDAQPDPVAEAVDVALGRLRVGLQGGMVPRFEIVAGHFLVDAAQLARFQRFDDGFERAEHVIVSLLDFGRSVAHAPRAREVVEVAAAGFLRKDVVHNGPAQRDGVAILAARVRHPGIRPDGEEDRKSTRLNSSHQ